jgi:hypothetical protein
LDPDRIDYPSILQDALRGVARRVLEQVAEYGLPGEHHLYVAFRTQAPGVVVPRFLRDQYPEEVTIVLQRQYWDLDVSAEAFSVTLNFNASRQRVKVPFSAMTAFVDPTAEFALRFEPMAAAPEEPAPAPAPALEAPARKAGDKAGEVIRFDPSRRK